MKFIFAPVAQNTIIRPMAQAVCLANGGVPVKYIDPVSHQEKEVTENDTSYLCIEGFVGERRTRISPHLIAFWSRHDMPIQVQVNVNDVQVMVQNGTTIEQAMTQFYQKSEQQNQPVSKKQLKHPCFQHTKA